MRPSPWLLLALAAALTACSVASVGRPIPVERVRTLERTVTTLEQVRERFGEPGRTRPGDTGTEIWEYGYVSRQPSRLTLWLCDNGLHPSRLITVITDITGRGGAARTPPYNPSDPFAYRGCSPAHLEQQLMLIIDQGVIASYR